MPLLRHAIQSAYYALNSTIVSGIGGINGLEAIGRWAHLLGGLRNRMGYIGSSRQDYLEELGNCYPELTDAEKRGLLRAFWDEHQRRFLELFILRDLSPDSLHKLFTFNNLENLERALAAGCGVVLPVPHFGNVRLHHVALSLKGYPVSVVSGDYAMEPKSVQKTKLEVESRLHHVGYLSQGTAWMVKALKRGDILQIASTSEASNQGAWVTLLGRDFFFPTGWIRLARVTGAAVLPSLDYRRPDGRYQIEILPEMDLNWSDDLRKDYQHHAQRLIELYEPYYRSMPEMVDWMYWLVRCSEAKKRKRIVS